MEKKRKPLYKCWWFWVLAVIVVFFLLPIITSIFLAPSSSSDSAPKLSKAAKIASRCYNITRDN